jgi:altronate dehydratase
MNEEQLDSFLFNREKRENIVFFNDKWNEPSSSKSDELEHLSDGNYIGGLTTPKEKSDWFSKINNEKQ